MLHVSQKASLSVHDETGEIFFSAFLSGFYQCSGIVPHSNQMARRGIRMQPLIAKCLLIILWFRAHRTHLLESLSHFSERDRKYITHITLELYFKKKKCTELPPTSPLPFPPWECVVNTIKRQDWRSYRVCQSGKSLCNVQMKPSITSIKSSFFSNSLLFTIITIPQKSRYLHGSKSQKRCGLVLFSTMQTSRRSHRCAT